MRDLSLTTRAQFISAPPPSLRWGLYAVARMRELPLRFTFLLLSRRSATQPLPKIETSDFHLRRRSAEKVSRLPSPFHFPSRPQARLAIETQLREASLQTQPRSRTRRSHSTYASRC